MKISPLNSITFGYNADLNKRMTRRLTCLKDCPRQTKSALLKINHSCNTVENSIRKFEGQNFERIVDNQKDINALADYLIMAKSYLCSQIDELMPELEFSKKECESYSKEMSDGLLDIPDGIEISKELDRAIVWRNHLITRIKDGMSEQSSQDMRSGPPLSAKNDDASHRLLEKFTPYSYSPKSLGDVVGLEKSIQDIKDFVILPLQDPSLAAQREFDYGIETPHFIIFFGPPGCGKTMLAEAIQAETGCDMYRLDISRIGSKYINEGPANVTRAFEELERVSVKADKPVLVFMDEMDSMLAQRHEAEGADFEDNKIVNTLLQHIVSAKDKNLIIIGATNMYDFLDSALKDRAQKELYIGLPSDEDRMKLIENKLSKYKMGVDLCRNQEDLKEVAIALRSYSPRSILSILNSAAVIAYRNQRELRKEDILQAEREENKEPINEDEYKPLKTRGHVPMGFSANL